MNIKSFSKPLNTKKIIYYSLIPIFLLTLTAFAFSSIFNLSDYQVTEGVGFKGSVCVYKNGEL